MFKRSPILSGLLLMVFISRAVSGNDYVLRWASSGGGWRSMVADYGYASAFAKAGLISTQDSQFAAISSTSGASWFTAQFFYSPEIFDVIVGNPGNGTAVAQFVTDWMKAYASIESDPPPNEFCQSLTNMTAIPGYEEIVYFCNFFAQYDFSWANFVQAMLNATATTFGDTDFAGRKASSDTRNLALQRTDLYIQTALTPNSRVTQEDGSQVVSYLGPNGSDKSFSVSLPMQYAVKDSYTFYSIGVEESGLPIIATTFPGPETFDFKNWSEFYLFSPGQNGVSPGNVLTTVAGLTVDGPFQEPFTGGANVIQVAAASSAASGDVSGTAPSVLAQLLSTVSFGIANAPIPPENKFVLQKILERGGDAIYRIPYLDDLGVCSQWPAKCTEVDGRLIDGGFIDGPSVAMNIGQYQTIDDGDLTVPIKLIVTNTNLYTDSNVKFLAYFNTTFNQEVEPGAFDWAPPTGSGVAQAAPWRSMRIFAEYLDDASLLAAFEPIEDTNLTTAVYTATTIDNPAFGVKAGQTVEILLLQINSNIPTTIIGLPATTFYTQPLAEMASTISSSSVLVQRIIDFLSPPLGTVSPTAAPTPAFTPTNPPRDTVVSLTPINFVGCMEVDGEVADDDQLLLGTCNTTEAKQQFKFDGRLIRSAVDETKCLQAGRNKTPPFEGQKMRIFTCDSSHPLQKFLWDSVNGGPLRLVDFDNFCVVFRGTTANLGEDPILVKYCDNVAMRRGWEVKNY